MNADLLILFKGLCTGFFYTFLTIAGMLLVAHYVIKEGKLQGFIAALGIIFVQGIWATIAAIILHFSYKGISPDNKTLSLVGSIVLFIMAIKIYRSYAKYSQKEPTKTRGVTVFTSGFLIALAIPIRIFGYMAIFLALDMHPSMPEVKESILPIVGVLLGTTLFWLIFIFTVERSKKIISAKALQYFHRFAAGVLIAFSVIGLLQLYF